MRLETTWTVSASNILVQLLSLGAYVAVRWQCIAVEGCFFCLMRHSFNPYANRNLDTHVKDILQNGYDLHVFDLVFVSVTLLNLCK